MKSIEGQGIIYSSARVEGESAEEISRKEHEDSSEYTTQNETEEFYIHSASICQLLKTRITYYSLLCLTWRYASHWIYYPPWSFNILHICSFTVHKSSHGNYLHFSLFQIIYKNVCQKPK